MRHRDGDLPAIMHANGDQEWFKHGKRHRDGDLPAIMHANGDQEWYKDDKRHRDGDLPAIIYADGAQSWFKYEVQHRDVGPAHVSAKNQPYYAEYGGTRGAQSSLGETMQSQLPASWSTVLCFM